MKLPISITLIAAYSLASARARCPRSSQYYYSNVSSQPTTFAYQYKSDTISDRGTPAVMDEAVEVPSLKDKPHPSLSCLLFNDDGCQLSCNLLCNLNGCQSEAFCRKRYYCECNEKYLVDDRALTPAQFKRLSFQDLWNYKFAESALSYAIRDLILSDDDLYRFAFPFLQNPRKSGEDLKNALLQRYPRLLNVAQNLQPLEHGVKSTLYDDTNGLTVQQYIHDMIQDIKNAIYDRITHVRYMRRIINLVKNITDPDDLRYILHQLYLTGNRRLYERVRRYLIKKGFYFDSEFFDGAYAGKCRRRKRSKKKACGCGKSKHAFLGYAGDRSYGHDICDDGVDNKEQEALIALLKELMKTSQTDGQFPNTHQQQQTSPMSDSQVNGMDVEVIQYGPATSQSQVIFAEKKEQRPSPVEKIVSLPQQQHHVSYAVNMEQPPAPTPPQQQVFRANEVVQPPSPLQQVSYGETIVQPSPPLQRVSYAQNMKQPQPPQQQVSYVETSQQPPQQQVYVETSQQPPQQQVSYVETSQQPPQQKVSYVQTSQQPLQPQVSYGETSQQPPEPIIHHNSETVQVPPAPVLEQTNIIKLPPSTTQMEEMIETSQLPMIYETSTNQDSLQPPPIPKYEIAQSPEMTQPTILDDNSSDEIHYEELFLKNPPTTSHQQIIVTDSPKSAAISPSPSVADIPAHFIVDDSMISAGPSPYVDSSSAPIILETPTTNYQQITVADSPNSVAVSPSPIVTDIPVHFIEEESAIPAASSSHIDSSSTPVILETYDIPDTTPPPVPMPMKTGPSSITSELIQSTTNSSPFAPAPLHSSKVSSTLTHITPPGTTKQSESRTYHLVQGSDTIPALPTTGVETIISSSSPPQPIITTQKTKGKVYYSFLMDENGNIIKSANYEYPGQIHTQVIQPQSPPEYILSADTPYQSPSILEKFDRQSLLNAAKNKSGDTVIVDNEHDIHTLPSLDYHIEELSQSNRTPTTVEEVAVHRVPGAVGPQTVVTTQTQTAYHTGTPQKASLDIPTHTYGVTTASQPYQRVDTPNSQIQSDDGLALDYEILVDSDDIPIDTAQHVDTNGNLDTSTDTIIVQGLGGNEATITDFSSGDHDRVHQKNSSNGSVTSESSSNAITVGPTQTVISKSSATKNESITEVQIMGDDDGDVSIDIVCDDPLNPEDDLMNF